MNEQEATEALANAKKIRVEECGKELKELLDKHNCELVTQQLIVNGNHQPVQITIVAR